MAGNNIFRGPLTRSPRSVSKPVAGAYLPGCFVEETATELVQIATSLAKLPMILSNIDFKDQTVATAYADEDTGIAYHIEPGDVYQARMANATYALNAPLKIAANGRLAAATTAGDIVIAFFSDTPGAFAADALADVTIANSYNVPAA